MRIITSTLAALALLVPVAVLGASTPSTATGGFTTVDLSHSASLVTEHGGLLYVTSESANIWVYDTSNLAAGPLRTISGSSTGLVYARQVAVDAAHGEMFLADFSGKVLVFPLGASGDAEPLRQISGDQTQLRSPTGITLHEDTIIITTIGGAILTFPRTAEGDVAPLRAVRGASTGLSETYSPTVDPVRQEVIVANYLGHSLTAYPLDAEGDVAPAWTLNTGAETGPDGLSIDFNRGTLLVSLCDAESLAVYPLGAREGDAPVQTVPAPDCLYGNSFDQETSRLWAVGWGLNLALTFDFTSRPTWSPTNVTASGTGPGIARVTWTKPSNPSWTTVTGYVATAFPGGRSCRVGAGATSCNITGLAAGTYRFAVTATNAGGGAATSTRSAEVLVARTPGRASVKGSQCVRGVPVVTFAGPSSTGGARITTYEYRYRVGSSGSIKTATSQKDSARLPAIARGSYEVSVAARNAAGLRGEFSAFTRVRACT